MSYICSFGVVDCPECLHFERREREREYRERRRVESIARRKPFNSPRIVYVEFPQASPDVSFADLMDRSIRLADSQTVYSKDSITEYVHITVDITRKV